MKSIFYPLLLLFVLLPNVLNAFPNKHSHKIPDDFRVSCKTWGFNGSPIHTNIVWDAKEKKLIIIGDGISDDNGRLIEGKGYGLTRTIHYVSTFYKGIKGVEGMSHDTKTLYMTFREDHHDIDAYHGKGWSSIRTFKFTIRGGAPGSIRTYEAAYIEGILDIGHGGILEDCTYSGINALP